MYLWGKRIPFDKYNPTMGEYKRFDAQNTAFSLKHQKLGADPFSYTKKVCDKMRVGVPGFSHPNISFKKEANTSDNRKEQGSTR